MLNRRLLFKTKPAAVAPKETITHHFFVSGIGRRNCLMQPQNLWAAQKMLLNRNPANIRKWIARFYYFRHLYSAGSACIAHNTNELPIDMGNSICTAHEYTLWFFQQSWYLVTQPLSEGEIIPFSGVCQSGRLHFHPRRRRWWLHALTDRLL